MQNIQDVFNRIKEKKIAIKNIQDQYKDALNSIQDYKETVEKIRGHKLRKKQLEDQTKEEMSGEYEKLEALKTELRLDRELLADIAISTMMKGETVKVEDRDKNEYEPIFKVSFKKVNEVRKG